MPVSVAGRGGGPGHQAQFAGAAGEQGRPRGLRRFAARAGRGRPLGFVRGGRGRGHRHGRPDGGGHGRFGGRAVVEFLPEDRGAYPLEFGRGVDAELLHEMAAGPLVQLQRLGLPAQLGQGRHQMTDEPFPGGMATRLPRELGRHFLGGAEGQPGLGAGLDGREP